ncbi:MAG: GGDEF domain-containing protein [Agathobacter sp.]|nr:GGDEF domain-containing protein [Agathobacter sp.]
MNKSKVISSQIIFYFLFALFVLAFLPDASSNLWQSLHDCDYYDSNWEIRSETTSDFADKLPVFYHTAEDEQDVWISKKLENVSNDDCIGFFSFQQQIEIFLDNEKVYSFVPASYAKSKTPGNKWNFLPLEESDNGKTVTIHINQCYNRGKVTIPTMYIGTQSGIAISYLKNQLPRIFLSIIMIFIGILISLFHVIKNNRTAIGDSLKWLALFAIFRGIWGLIEGNSYSFFVSRLLLISQLSYMSLKIAATLFLQFLNESFYHGNNKIIRWLTIFSISEFFVTVTLQFTGIADFATTIFITHALLLVAGMYSCADIAYSLYKRHKSSRDRIATNHYSSISQLFCTIIIIISSLVDMYRYYTTNSPDVARFCRIGDFLFVMIMSFGLFLDFVNLLKMGQKAAIFREQASFDPMTKLFNRMRFEKDIAKANRHTLNGHGIIVLDLNNLKLFNDKIGHDAGDNYIISASKIIYDTFSNHGTIYRIGGDEFCIITKHLSNSKFIELRNEMENLLDIDISPEGVPPMSVACGFALFDSNIDESLHDTMKRADEEMYRRKKELKGL